MSRKVLLTEPIPPRAGDVTEAADIVFSECALPRNDVTHLHGSISLDVNMRPSLCRVATLQ